MIDERRNQNVAHFECDSLLNSMNSAHISDKSYLKSGQLKRLLEKSDSYCDYWCEDTHLCLFGQTVTRHELSATQITLMFNYVKKYVHKLRNGSLNMDDNQTHCYDRDYCELRYDICEFLAFLKRFTHTKCVLNVKYVENASIICIFKELKSLLLFVGRLSQLTPQLIDLAVHNDSKAVVYNYYHCCLDIWWTAIELTFMSTQNNLFNFNEFVLVKQDIQNDVYSQAIKMLTYDLIALTLHRFNEVSSHIEYLTLSPFPCVCVKEMFIMIKLLNDNRNIKCGETMYFDLLLSVSNLFSNFDATHSVSIMHFETISLNLIVNRAIIHNIWLLSTISCVFKYGLTGNYFDNLNYATFHSSILKIINQILKSNEIAINEEELSCVILLFINSLNNWELNSNILLPFTEFFLKKLNYKEIASNSVENIKIIPKISYQWKKIIEEIATNNFHSFHGYSFIYYLCLLYRQLTRIFELCEEKIKSNHWQKFKGKVIANLQPKRLDKISEIGVFNLFSFYLILLNSNKIIWNEITDKAVDVMCDISKQNNYKNLELIFKFGFTAFQMTPNTTVEKKLYIFIRNQFNNLLNGISLSSNISNFVNIYFEELKLLIDNNRFFDASIDELLFINFSTLSNLGTNDNLFVLNFISDFMIYVNRTIERVSSRQDYLNLSIINACMDHILPYIKQEINSSKNCCETLADIAYNFNLLIINTLEDNNSNFSAMFIEFLRISKTNSKFTIRYIILCLENRKMAKILKLESAKIGSNLLISWCRLLVSSDLQQSLLDKLSLSLSSIFIDLSVENIMNGVNSKDIFIQFLRNFSNKYNECAFNAKTTVIQEFYIYINEIVLISEVIIKHIQTERIAIDQTIQSTISRIYTYISNTVLIASPLLYVRGKPDCLLPKLFDLFIVPPANANMTSHFNITMQKTFPIFFEGICKLPYNGDKYLERIIRNMISFYLPIFIKQAKKEQNIYLFIKNNFLNEKIAHHWNDFLLEVVINNILPKIMNCVSPDLMQYLSELCINEITIEKYMTLLTPSFEKSLICENALKEIYFKHLRIMIEKIKNSLKCQNENVSRLLMPIVSSFIERNLSSKETLTRFYDILDLISNVCPEILHEITGDITRNIEFIEKNRNIGKDSILRDALLKFVNKSQYR